MPEDPSSRLVRLFGEACGLSGAELQRFLSELDRDDPATAAELRQLLAADEDSGDTSKLKLAEGIPPELALEALMGGGVDAQALEEDLIRLGEWSTPGQRLVEREEIGRGAMGAVHSVWDPALRREVARKTLLTGAGGERATKGSLARFLTEARVTGRLEHPGIVPVHDLGLDERGRVYFTMQRVAGRDLQAVYALERSRAEGWGRARLLGVLLRVCEAMAYAHSQGVLHRDLKPSNVMVGAFGEVYVMDWGVARAEEARDQSAESPGPEHEGDTGIPVGVRTVSGAVVGTPHYMSPEQAAGNTSEVDERTDVYALGAMLYELLAHRRPFGDEASPRTLLRRLAQEDPEPLPSDSIPAELVAICTKAMARRREDRYATMEALGADLRAYLEGRVVSAHRTGALVELHKWVRRNRLTAAALGIAAVALLGGTIVAKAQERRASQKVREFDQLKGVVLLESARSSEKRLYPAWPGQIQAMEAWLQGDWQALAGMKPELQETLTTLEEGAARGRDGAPVFESQAPRFLYETLTGLLAEMASFEQVQRKGVERRLAWARRIGALSRDHPRAPVSLAEVREVLRSSPRYRDRAIEFEDEDFVGLVPLGTNPTTGLLEFYHLRSAWDGLEDPATLPLPRLGDDGSIALQGGTGIVFVLLPGGSCTLGAQKDDPMGPNYDLRTEPDEGIQQFTLAPFFLARHELTKGQWQRLGEGESHSWYRAGETYEGDPVPVGDTHPVEDVSWFTAEAFLRRHGLSLPTEAQWEYACRAGTSGSWSPGTQASALEGHANVLDLGSAAAHPGWGVQEGDFHDGYVVLAPVGSFEPNPLGLFDMHGNIWEWCLDEYGPYGTATRAGDGLRLEGDGSADRIYRGGGFNATAAAARSAYRGHHAPTVQNLFLGLRAARALRP